MPPVKVEARTTGQAGAQQEQESASRKPTWQGKAFPAMLRGSGLLRLLALLTHRSPTGMATQDSIRWVCRTSTRKFFRLALPALQPSRGVSQADAGHTTRHFLVSGPRIPVPGRRAPTAILAVPSACPPLAGFRFPVPRSRFPLLLPSALVTPFPALAYKNSAYRAIVSPCSALTYKNGCPQVSCSPFPVPRSRLLGVIHSDVWPYISSKFRHFRVKNRSNGVKIGSKKVKKGAHFVMPILTFWV